MSDYIHTVLTRTSRLTENGRACGSACGTGMKKVEHVMHGPAVGPTWFS